MNDPYIDPFKATSPNHSSLHSFSSSREESSLKKEAEQLYAYLAYVSSSPTEYKKAFEYLTILMVLGGSCLLKKEEEEKAHGALTLLKDDLYGGAISYSKQSFQEHLGQIIYKIIEENPRAKLLKLSIELEYLLTIHVPEPNHPLDSRDCARLLDPIRAKIYDQAISSLHMINLGKQIDNIKLELEENPEMRHHHLQRLETLFQSL